MLPDQHVMDVEALRRALDGASLTEYAEPLSERLGELNQLGADKKELIALLKDAGCSKMGVRQKLATVLMCELARAVPAVPAADEEPKVTGDAFWGQLAQTSALGLDFDIPAPTSAAADLALVSAPKLPPAAVSVAPLPPELRAARPTPVVHTTPTDHVGESAPELEQLPATALPLAAPGEAVALEATAPRAPTATSAAPAASDAPYTTQRACAVGSAATAAYPAPARPLEPERSAQAQQADLFRKLGDEAFGRKDVKAAERWFAQALAATPRSVELLARLASCALAAAPPRLRLALTHLRRLLQLPPPHGDARLQAARCCVELGELDEALVHAEAAVASAPPPPPPLRGVIAPPDAPSEFLVRARGLHEEIVYLQGHIERSQRLGGEGRTLEALQASRIVRQACVASLLGTTLAVDALQSQGRLSEAIDEAREGAAKLPHLPLARVLLARLLARKGQVADAEAELGQAMARAGADADASADASAEPGADASADTDCARAAAALDGLRRAVELKAEGNGAYGAGQFERALTLYTEALDADTEGFISPVLFGNRSQAYAKISSFALAVADCDRALAIDAEHIKLRLRRAACRIELGDVPGAITDYETILEQDPENAAAVAGLEHAEEVPKWPAPLHTAPSDRPLHTAPSDRPLHTAPSDRPDHAPLAPTRGSAAAAGVGVGDGASSTELSARSRTPHICRARDTPLVTRRRWRAVPTGGRVG